MVSPYSSMEQIKKERYGFVPSFLLRYPLHSDEALRTLRGSHTKVLLLHGDRDALIPYAHSEALSAISPDIKLQRIEGAGHNDIQTFEPYLAALRAAISASVRP